MYFAGSLNLRNFLVLLSLVWMKCYGFTKKNLWPYGVILYKFDGSFDSQVMREKVLRDFRFLEALTCLRFAEVYGCEILCMNYETKSCGYSIDEL